MNLHRCLRILPILIACLALAASPLRAADVPRVILDQDMSSDHDDVGDIAVLHGLASLGEIQIIGMMVSSRNYGTAQYMDAVNTWYGKPDIPIGIPPDIGGVGEYPGMAVGTGRWPHTMGATKDAGLASGDCMWAKDLYRKLLAESPDHSVVIVTTGYLQNVEALMQSAPDGYSTMNGMDLVRQKVRLLSCAGGDYPNGSEFNFRVGDTMPRPAYTVVNNWPTAAWFVSYNMGQSIYTGGLLAEARADSPIRYVYVDSNNEDYPYPSWGQQMVYFAARGLDTFWDGQSTGRNNADVEGSNWWTATPDPSGAAEQGYLLETVRSPVRESLDALIMLEPNDGTPCRPGQPSNLRATVASGSRIDLQWRDNAFNETGFRIERGINGVYTQVGSVGADVTSFADTGLATTANTAYRVRAYNATGDSRHAQTWVYSGWTEVNLSSPATLPLYTSYQPGDLRWGREPYQFDHVVLNNDSTHGQDLTIAVDAGALSNQGTFYVYFLYQNQDNWYRLVYDNLHDAQEFRFEKRIGGTTTTVGSPRVLAHTLPVQNSEHALHGIGGGSRLRPWQIQVAPGSLSFMTSEQSLVDDDTPLDGGVRVTSTITLDVSETLGLASGLIGLGSHNQCPMWENFRFTTGSTGGLAPAIVAHPQSTAVFAGRTTTLAVAASGTGPLAYQWKHGTADVGTGGATLTIASAQFSDAGAYTCVVTNGSGSATSNAATLTVNAVVAPAITGQPANSLVPVGDTAVFTVVASGTAPLTYQWRKGTTGIGTDSATLAIADAQAGDAGSYTCTVSNSAGSATSDPAVLTLTAALDPVIAAAALFDDGGGTYGGYPNTAAKAFDGDTATFYDAATASGAYTGIDAGTATTVTALRYRARAGQVGRMIGGVFEGSNAQGTGYVTLATVGSASGTVWTTMLVDGAAAYRYLRYRGPNGGSCNVAEIEFHGTSGTPTPLAPTITAQPADAAVTAGQTATFTMVASGSGPLGYQWKRGTTNVGTGSATLTIADAQEADEGLYTCVVTNSVGSATSNPATLTVNAAAVAPTITAQPTDVTLVAGQAATFTVTANGTGPLSYQWKRGTTDVGTGSATLTIANAQLADAGSYTCVVTNSAGSATSDAAALTVTTAVVAPAITGQPADATVVAGQTATFTVTASGTGPLSYQWKRGTTDVGTGSATLSIADVHEADGGSYTCLVTNSAGSATSDAAMLTVTSGGGLDPLITWAAMIDDGGGAWGGSGHTAETVFDGDTATFYDPQYGFGAYTGIDVGTGNAVTVTAIRFWARAGWPQRMVDGVFEGSNSPTSGYATLATVVSASDTAWTTLLVTDAAAYRYLRFRTPDTVWCNVAEIEFHGTSRAPAPTAPTISGQPADAAVTAGQTATFTVTASGSGPLSYQWKHGATDVGADSATLTIVNAQEADAGSYTCVVTNSAGSATSAIATLTVTTAAVAPVITGQPTDATVTAGQTATFTVTASGSGPLSYQWKHGATDVGADSATLTIVNAQEADAGSYTCAVTNSAGSATSAIATLTVTTAAVAPVITGQPADATVTAGQTATFTVTASGSGPLSYQWKHGATDVGADSATLTIANAQEADAGSYTCVVTNSAGSAVSTAGILAVQTATAPPTPAPPRVYGNNTVHPIISGVGTVGTTIHIFDGGTEIGTVVIGVGGSWNYAVGELAVGSHVITITASNADGMSASSPAITVKVTTLTPPPGGSPANAVPGDDSGGGCGAGNLTPVIAGLLCLLVGLRIRG